MVVSAGLERPWEMALLVLTQTNAPTKGDWQCSWWWSSALSPIHSCLLSKDPKCQQPGALLPPCALSVLACLLSGVVDEREVAVEGLVHCLRPTCSGAANQLTQRLPLAVVRQRLHSTARAVSKV